MNLENLNSFQRSNATNIFMIVKLEGRSVGRFSSYLKYLNHFKFHANVYLVMLWETQWVSN